MGYKRRKFGQHFLVNNAVAKRIVSVLQVKPDETVVEIGSGRGVLTKELIKSGAQIVGVEIEPTLIAFLKRAFRSDNFIVVHSDILKFDLTKYQDVKIIGNIPYKISSPLIEKLIENRNHWLLSILTFQKEFATRLVAKPKTKSYGALSIFFQTHLEGEILFDIPALFFSPPPKVKSSVLKILSKKTEMDKAFHNFVRKLFSQRRKMLRSILKGIKLPDYYSQKRPEDIGVEEMIELYQYCLLKKNDT